MSAQTLITEHLDLWAGAVTKKSSSGRGGNRKVELTGIKKLRELILELAVRGKLVEQNPNDEPAPTLLTRIKDIEQELVKSKRIRKPKHVASISAEEAEFNLPSSWQWVRLGAIGQIVGGGTPKSGEPSFWSDKGIPWLTPADLYGLKEKFIASGNRDISELGLAKSSAQLLPLGSVLFSSRAPIGYVAITSGELATNQGFKSCVPRIQEMNQFIYYFLKRSAPHIDASASGTTFKEVSGTKVASIPMPLPPLEEQHRIVQKVDELMAICDRLEQQTSDQLDAHETLVETLLGTLTQSANATELADNWARLAEHFDTLFTTEQSIGKLKQSILQLAVMGRLVEQDEGDEPVINLLKQHYIISKPCSLNGWAEVSLGNLGTVLGGSTPTKSKGEFWNGSIPWVSPKDMKCHLIKDSQIRVTEQALSQSNLKLVPENSLIMVVRGMILAHSFPVAITESEVTINQDMKALTPPDEISKYLLLYLQASKHKVVELVDRSSHGTCKLISKNNK